MPLWPFRSCLPVEAKQQDCVLTENPRTPDFRMVGLGRAEDGVVFGHGDPGALGASSCQLYFTRWLHKPNLRVAVVALPCPPACNGPT